MNIVETALSYIGKVKYVFGADNIDAGVGDCSSFTETIFRKHGIEIGTDTEIQWTSKEGIKVSKDDLKAGDLIFFKDTYDSNHTDGVSHVGIYTGNNKFVHLGNGGVKEDSLSSEYWTTHYLGAKRYSDIENSIPETINTDLNVFGDILVVIIISLLIIIGVVLLVLGVNNK